MLYSEKLKDFQSAHKYESTVVNGARYRYILCGKESGKTLVFLNGGMNTLEMWMDYVDPICADARVLLFTIRRSLPRIRSLLLGCTLSLPRSASKSPYRRRQPHGL